jgi:hypothetical protein
MMLLSAANVVITPAMAVTAQLMVKSVMNANLHINYTSKE